MAARLREKTQLWNFTELSFYFIHGEWCWGNVNDLPTLYTLHATIHCLYFVHHFLTSYYTSLSSCSLNLKLSTTWPRVTQTNARLVDTRNARLIYHLDLLTDNVEAHQSTHEKTKWFYFLQLATAQHSRYISIYTLSRNHSATQCVEHAVQSMEATKNQTNKET